MDSRAQENCDQLDRLLDMHGRTQKVRMPSEIRIIMKENYVTTHNSCKGMSPFSWKFEDTLSTTAPSDFLRIRLYEFGHDLCA